MSDSIVLARKSIHDESSQITAPGKGVALCLLLVDRSSSMQVHGDTPRTAANELIATIRDAPGADRTLFGLMTFGSDVTLDVAPVRACHAPLLDRYEAKGSTALFKAVHDALAIAHEFHGFAKTVYGADAKVAISVITDGADTVVPSSALAPKTRKLAEIARGKGFVMQAIGLGIDSTELAKLLGFEPGLARNAPASRAGIHASMHHTSGSFLGTMSFLVNDDTPDPSDAN